MGALHSTARRGAAWPRCSQPARPHPLERLRHKPRHVRHNHHVGPRPHTEVLVQVRQRAPHGLHGGRQDLQHGAAQRSTAHCYIAVYYKVQYGIGGRAWTPCSTQTTAALLPVQLQRLQRGGPAGGWVRGNGGPLQRSARASCAHTHGKVRVGRATRLEGTCTVGGGGGACWESQPSQTQFLVVAVIGVALLWRDRCQTATADAGPAATHPGVGLLRPCAPLPIAQHR